MAAFVGEAIRPLTKGSQEPNDGTMPEGLTMLGSECRSRLASENGSLRGVVTELVLSEG